MQRNGATASNVSIRSPGTPPAEWPLASLDVEAYLGSGRRARSLTQFILKVHGRCNLSCAYCYVFEGPDQSWRRRPARMAEATVARTAERIAEHARAHRLSRVQVVFHGGEPLLAGPAFLGFAASTLRSALSAAGTELGLSVTTNGTLIDRPTLDVLREHRVRVGVSVDGDEATHDARRPRGRGGSHAELRRGIELLRTPAYRELFAGLLCVVDPQSDPVATYEHLLGYEPPAVDVLLPHANWSSPPPRPPDASPTPYGDWLVALFDRWYLASRRETSIRFFDEILRGLVGRPSRVETIGLGPARLAVIETDGAIEQIDALKTAYEGASATGLDVDRHPFDAVLRHPGILARQMGVDALADSCRRCDLLDVCGGGFYPHRYHQGSGFRHRSVYCGDLARLIRHVESRVRHDLAPVLARSAR